MEKTSLEQPEKLGQIKLFSAPYAPILAQYVYPHIDEVTLFNQLNMVNTFFYHHTKEYETGYYIENSDRQKVLAHLRGIQTLPIEGYNNEFFKITSEQRKHLCYCAIEQDSIILSAGPQLFLFSALATAVYNRDATSSTVALHKDPGYYQEMGRKFLVRGECEVFEDSKAQPQIELLEALPVYKPIALSADMPWVYGVNRSYTHLLMSSYEECAQHKSQYVVYVISELNSTRQRRICNCYYDAIMSIKRHRVCKYTLHGSRDHLKLQIFSEHGNVFKDSHHTSNMGTLCKINIQVLDKEASISSSVWY